jgi:hypothetical protein
MPFSALQTIPANRSSSPVAQVWLTSADTTHYLTPLQARSEGCCCCGSDVVIKGGVCRAVKSHFYRIVRRWMLPPFLTESRPFYLYLLTLLILQSLILIKVDPLDEDRKLRSTYHCNIILSVSCKSIDAVNSSRQSALHGFKSSASNLSKLF